jgi:tetratricopeptide (TPR) repeat protein
MSSIIPGYEYDIFISYRQKDNKYDGWVTAFVDNLKKELEATFKEDISVFFDTNSHDGLLETNDVNASLREKLKCLVFIPIISQTYCDIKSFAWQNEFCFFNKLAKTDQFGRDIRLANGNVSSRILPVKIHELDVEDITLLENETGVVMRSVEFIYKEAGVNRPLKPADSKTDNQNKTDYRNQVNKVANAVKEIIGSLKKTSPTSLKSPGELIPVKKTIGGNLKNMSYSRKVLFVLFSVIGVTLVSLLLNRYYFSEKSSVYLFEFFSILVLAVSAILMNKYYLSAKGLKDEVKTNMTENHEAYDWFKKAEFRLTPEDNCDIDSCIYFLKKAIDADSSFALAHAELSRAYSFKNYFIDHNSRFDEKAFIEAEKSLYLNPNLAEGFFAKAYSRWTFQNKFPHEKVIREYKKAISLKAGLDEAYHYLGVVYMHVGMMQEAIDTIKRAVLINPDNKIASLDLITCYFFCAKKTDLEQVMDMYKQTPDHLLSPMRTSFWAIALITLERLSDAKKILSAGIKKVPSDLFINSASAILHIKEGDMKGALERIEYCEQSNLNTGHYHHAVYNLAVAYALLGKYQESVDNLTWVAENGFPNYTFFRDDQLLESLHKFTPYTELLKKLKISNDKFRKIANE